MTGQYNTENVFVEVSQLFSDKRPTTIRVGSCRGLRLDVVSIQLDVAVGDLVVTSRSVRLENTSTLFVDEGYQAAANHEVVMACSWRPINKGFLTRSV